jgi:hypothetical protein
VGPRDQFLFLRAQDNQIKLSTFATALELIHVGELHCFSCGEAVMRAVPQDMYPDQQ